MRGFPVGNWLWCHGIWIVKCLESVLNVTDFSNGVFAQAISCRKLGARASRLPPLQLKHQHEASEPEDCYRSRPLPLV
ncbi:uncharacterized protein [Physcomitrium patens]|uniref:uncharacterized protein isoform X5 n=1 Tax=Physcomitrium patens TaxID=3218 RepID=UPI003CCCD445